jgi:DNA-binding NarL/FixJ family response regulator
MPKAQPIGVLVCDDHAAMRLGIQSILQEAGMHVINAVGTVDDCLAQACDDDVDVFIVDLNVGETRGTTIVDLIRERNRRARVLVYSGFDNIPTISAVYESGAAGFVHKASEPVELIEAIKRIVSTDKPYFGPGVAEELAIFYTSGARKIDPRSILTERELTIFTLLAEGRSPKTVADMLGVTEKSIANRAVTIRHKLHIPRTQFTAFAIEHSLIESDHAHSARENHA